MPKGSSYIFEGCKSLESVSVPGMDTIEGFGPVLVVGKRTIGGSEPAFAPGVVAMGMVVEVSPGMARDKVEDLGPVSGLRPVFVGVGPGSCCGHSYIADTG